MVDFLIGIALPLLGTFSLGAVGWLVTHFVSAQVLSFYRLRGAIFEEMIVAENITRESFDDERRQAASAEMRRQAAQLMAIQYSASVKRHCDSA